MVHHTKKTREFVLFTPTETNIILINSKKLQTRKSDIIL